MVMIIICKTLGFSSQRIKTISTRAPTNMVIMTAAAIAIGRGMNCNRDIGYHTAEHDKLPLGEVDDTCRVVNDVKPYGHDCINGAIGDTCKQVLKKKIYTHNTLQTEREAGSVHNPAGPDF